MTEFFSESEIIGALWTFENTVSECKIEKLEYHTAMVYGNYIFCWSCNLDLSDHNEINFPKKDHSGYPRKKKITGDEMQFIKIRK